MLVVVDPEPAAVAGAGVVVGAGDFASPPTAVDEVGTEKFFNRAVGGC